MFLVSLVVLMIMAVVAVKAVGLRDKIDAKAAEEQQLDEQIEDEEARAESIEEFAKEVQTKGYIEEVAREKLGLVYENEILFKEDN
jgi:cell division protein FtsB